MFGSSSGKWRAWKHSIETLLSVEKASIGKVNGVDTHSLHYAVPAGMTACWCLRVFVNALRFLYVQMGRRHGTDTDIRYPISDSLA